MSLTVIPFRHNGNGTLTSTKNGRIMRETKSYVRLYSYPVVEDYKNLWDVANLLLQKTPSDNFTATMKLTFSPNQKNKGERTGLVVMGRDYAGLVLENTDKGLVLSQVECDRADKGKPEEVRAAVDLSQNTVLSESAFQL